MGPGQCKWKWLSISYIGRTIPLLKPPQSPHCWARRLTTRKKSQPTHSHTAKPGLIVLIRPLRPHCSRTLWCYPLILRYATDAKFALNFISWCHLVEWCVTAPYSWGGGVGVGVGVGLGWGWGWGGGFCSGAWKHDQDSHVGMFSLCADNPHPKMTNCWYSETCL